MSIVAFPFVPWEQFLTKDDWNDLSTALHENRQPSPAVRALSRANWFVNEEDPPTALVESVIGLELAVDAFLTERFARSGIPGQVQMSLGKFYELPLGVRMITALAALEQPIEPNIVTSALMAVKMRNDYVHKGKLPPPSAKDRIQSIFHIVCRLLPSPGPKVPVWAQTARMLYSAEMGQGA
jgi:hypothetical protein